MDNELAAQHGCIEAQRMAFLWMSPVELKRQNQELILPGARIKERDSWRNNYGRDRFARSLKVKSLDYYLDEVCIQSLLSTAPNEPVPAYSLATGIVGLNFEPFVAEQVVVQDENTSYSLAMGLNLDGLMPQFVSEDQPVQAALKKRDHSKKQKKKFTCNECGKRYAVRATMYRHRNVEHARYECSMCDLAFYSEYGLSVHNALKHCKKSK